MADEQITEFTGERFHPEMSGQILFEHLHRYYLARPHARGRRVLDLASGEGYGSSILAGVASAVTGVDIAVEAVAHARERYRAPNLSFVQSSAVDLPFEDGSFDLVVSFETIEHHDQHREMMREVKRVLAPDGLLIISSPNKQHYSIDTGYRNPFHVKELFREEFLSLVGDYFGNVKLLSQRVVHGSLIALEGRGGTTLRSSRLSDGELQDGSGLLRPLYDIVVASDGQLPAMHSSLFEADVHGLDAATFYGVHLPERVAGGDVRVAQLEAELQQHAVTNGTARELLDGLRTSLENASSAALASHLETIRSDLERVEAAREDAELKEARRAEARLAEIRLAEARLAETSRQREVELAEAREASRRVELELAEAESARSALERQLAGLGEECRSLRRMGEERISRIAALEALRGTLESRLQQVDIEKRESQARMESSVEAAQGEARRAEIELAASASARAVLEKQIVALQNQVDSLRRESEERRRQAHDLLIDKEAEISRLADDNKRMVARVTEGERENMGLKHQLAEAEVAARQQEAALARAESDAIHMERRLRDDLMESEKERAALRGELATMSQTLQRRESQLQNLRIIAEARNYDLEAILGSKSWKLTAPLRWLRRGFRGGPFDVAMARGALLPSDSRSNDAGGHADKRHEPAAGAQAPSALAAPAADIQFQPRVRDAYLHQLFSPQGDGEPDEYVARSELPPPAADALRAKVIAFYLPQFHRFPENDAWWGPGFTEWTNVTKAVPQFLGHHQPQLPSGLGFYDLRVADTIRDQVKMARQYGIHGFCFHYYWFAGKRLLERPLDLFIENEDIDFPFCLCWANENWTRRWDGQDSEILMSQEHTSENDLAFIKDLATYLRDPRYIRIDGKPLVIVYRPSILPDCRKTLELWREYCRSVGIGEIFLAMVQFDTNDPRPYGFDCAMEFPPHKLAAGLDAINQSLDIINPHYRGHVVHYQSIVERAKEFPKPDYAMVRGVFPGWDNEARRPSQGYTFAFSTPERYREWLDFAVAYAEENPVGGEKLVMVNAWNEWAEGAHLEPDRKFGYAFLEATRDVVERAAQGPKVVVVSHDAHPHGAQYLALNLVRELQRIGCAVEVVLLGSGPLRDQFADACALHEIDAGDARGVAELAKSLVDRGFELVVANTAVSGRVVKPFKDSGARVVSLIHELPGVIRQYGLEPALEALAESADRIVVPSEAVARGLEEFIEPGKLSGSMMIRPQGLFTRSRYRSAASNAEAREALRRKLGIPADSRVVLSIGYADKRKGVDLLARIAGICGKHRDDLHFVWVGHHDITIQNEVAALLEGNGMEARFHFTGLDFDTDDYYAGADVYALASREDPFPSVVLESLSVGTPVIAFKGTGGAADFIEHDGGKVVEAFDIEAFAAAIGELLDDEPTRAALGNAGRRAVDRDFSFRAYSMDLLASGGAGVPRVSVVVPNFNYAHYMRDRLGTIASQTLPVYEIIVLDDCSTDDSVDVMRKLGGDLHPEPQIVVNERNSGSVFRQWLRGVELARGDFVWIAEADDLAHPGFLEALVEPMLRDPSIVMAYCQSRQIDEHGKVLADDYLAYTDDISRDRWCCDYVAEGRDEVEAAMAIKNVVPNVSGVLFRRDALLKVLEQHIEEICRYRIAGDWIAYLNLLQHGRIAFLQGSFNSHRRHSNSVTIGSAVKPHFEEVLSAQRAAKDLFGLGEKAIERQEAYARKLARHFGMDFPARSAIEAK